MSEAAPEFTRVVPLFVDEKDRYVWECPRCGQKNRARTSNKARGCACGAHVRLDATGRVLTREDMLRASAYRRSGGRCYLCGGFLFADWTVDHLRAIANGGPRRHKANLVAAHARCNEFKGRLSFASFFEKAQRALNEAAAFAGMAPPRLRLPSGTQPLAGDSKP